MNKKMISNSIGSMAFALVFLTLTGFQPAFGEDIGASEWSSRDGLGAEISLQGRAALETLTRQSRYQASNPRVPLRAWCEALQGASVESVVESPATAMMKVSLAPASPGTRILRPARCLFEPHFTHDASPH